MRAFKQIIQNSFYHNSEKS